MDSGDNNGYRIFGLSFDPLANLNLNYMQAGGAGGMLVFNYLYISALSNGIVDSDVQDYIFLKKKSKKSVYVLKKAGADKNIRRPWLSGLDGGVSPVDQGMSSAVSVPGMPVTPVMPAHM